MRDPKNEGGKMRLWERGLSQDIVIWLCLADQYAPRPSTSANNCSTRHL